MESTVGWTPFREPFARTLARNVAIAVILGAALAIRQRDLALVLPNSALALWFSLGGHYVEVAFLNGIRPRIASTWLAQRSARLAAWFTGGAMLYVLMATTARVLPVHAPPLKSWWMGGLILIGVEFVAHASLAFRGRPNFYDGKG
jgi:hypothetical protein